MTDNYTRAGAIKLSKFDFQKSNESSDIKIYWLNSFSADANPELINKNRHEHTFYEAHFVLRGTHDFIDADNNVLRLKAGDAIVFSPGEKHTVIGFGSDMLRISVTFLPIPAAGGFIITNNIGKAHVFGISDELERYIECVFSEITKGDRFSDILIPVLARGMIAECARALGAVCDTNRSESRDESTAIRKAKLYISDNIEKRLTCAEVAKYCHFNAKYLSRIFKASVGVSLLEYIQKEKAKRAEYLLKESDLSLKQISDRLGFASEYHFNSFFSKRFGISPGRVRKSARPTAKQRGLSD